MTPPASKSKSKGGKIAYDSVWLASQPAAKGGAEFECLATALYFEARGEGIKGQAAVAEVILNRVESPQFPRTVCGVVNQSNGRGCQFSYHLRRLFRPHPRTGAPGPWPARSHGR